MLSLVTSYGCTTRHEEVKSTETPIASTVEKPKQKAEDSLALNSHEKALLDKLAKVDKQTFIGKTVGSFIKQSTIKEYKDYYFIDEPPGHLNHLTLVYSDKIHIEIYAQKLEYTKIFSETGWNLKVYAKEKIKEIRLCTEHRKCVEIIN
jgi:hypothetical protein